MLLKLVPLCGIAPVCSITIYKYTHTHTHLATIALPLMLGITVLSLEYCDPTKREHSHPDLPIPLQSVPPPMSLPVRPSLWTASPPLPPSYPFPECGGAVHAAVWFSDRQQSCCFLADNKTHFCTMGITVSSACLCCVWQSGRGEGLNIGVQG